MIKAKLFVIFIAMICVSCQTDQGIKMHKQNCVKYGFEKDTDAMAECIQREHHKIYYSDTIIITD